MPTIRDITRDVLIELGLPGAADTPSSEDTTLVYNKYLRVLDNWNAERGAVYGSEFTTYALTPNLSPHTIGPSAATYTVAQRPVSIDGANLVINTVTPAVSVPITVRDENWWNAVAVKALTSTAPTDVYYDPAWPNGRLFFYPIPTVAYDVELMTRILLSTVTLNTTFAMPPGYQDAMTLTLAEECAASFLTQASPDTKASATKARARIFGNNTVIPKIATADAGMPSGHGVRATFNYLVGWPRT